VKARLPVTKTQVFLMKPWAQLSKLLQLTPVSDTYYPLEPRSSRTHLPPGKAGHAIALDFARKPFPGGKARGVTKDERQ
jgi:hypothetical protein